MAVMTQRLVRANGRRVDPTRVLLVAEGSGGHLIPALEVGQALVKSGVRVRLLYAQRPQTARLLQELLEDVQTTGLTIQPVALRAVRPPWVHRILRVAQSAAVWRAAHAQLTDIKPQAVVGFGGWFCVPVILAARWRGIPVLLHEQNVALGRANRFLLRWADQLALSFPSYTGRQGRALTALGSARPRPGTQRSWVVEGSAGGRETDGPPPRWRGLHNSATPSSPPVVVTGLPVRRAIKAGDREQAARRFRVTASDLTVLVMGGSQGARAVNRLVCETVSVLSREERRTWQFVHLTGPQDAHKVRQVYARYGVRAWVGAHLADMAGAYSLADVVIARAGASTIAELAACGMPAILLPFPGANGHQRLNARLVEAAGAGVCLDEPSTTPRRLLGTLRRFLRDERLRDLMGRQMDTLAQPDATGRLAEAIVRLCQRGERRRRSRGERDV